MQLHVMHFFYFDFVESLPTYNPLDPSDLKPSNSRYDVQISVFGSKLQKKLQDANIFIVG
jgi:ubiquitin-activating enzyme E1